MLPEVHTPSLRNEFLRVFRGREIPPGGRDLLTDTFCLRRAVLAAHSFVFILLAGFVLRRPGRTAH
jgi:hypothetical protein